MHTHKLTKIVATVGPASESPEMMAKLIDAGVNVFRFNTKHSTPEWHAEHIKTLQKVADEKGVTVGILLDLQGPEIRLETRDKEDITVTTGEHLSIGRSFVDGVNVIIPHANVFQLLKAGDDLLVDDGFVETKVLKVTDDELVVECLNDSVIKNRKGVNLPGIDVDFPSLIESDIAQLDHNASSKIDYVGLSFVRSGRDVKLLRSEMDKRGMKAMIVGKIESQPALDRLDEIIEQSDVIMVARGDLGVEVPFEQLAYYQRLIIDKCRLKNKPVITATQMLESMISNPRPTRAEVTDVAHAVIEGTDAVMLSAESASGKYPVRAVSTQAKIAKWNELAIPSHHLEFSDTDPTSIVAQAVAGIVNSEVKPKINALVVFTETGYTARAISRYRLKIPVIAVTATARSAEAMTVSYGLYPVIMDLPRGVYDNPDEILNSLVKKDIIHRGDTVVVVHGHHWHKPGNTNSLNIVTL